MTDSVQPEGGGLSAEERGETSRPGQVSRPSVPEKEEDPGKRAFIWLGVILLIAFLLPVIIPEHHAVRVIFPNFLVLGNEEAPGLLRFLCLYPLLAGIATIVIAAAVKGFGRSIAFIAIALLPLFVLIGNSEIRKQFFSEEFLRESGTGAPLLFGGALSALAMVGIYVGSRARFLRPKSSAAAIVGAIGGGLYLLALVLPTQPKELGVIPLVAPFKLLRSEEVGLFDMRVGLNVFAGTIGLIQIGLLVAAAILCLTNATPRTDADRRGHLAFGLWIASVVVAGIGSLACFLVGLQAAAGDQVGEILAPTLSVVFKIGLWLLGFYLLIPMGVTDLVVCLSGDAATEVAVASSLAADPLRGLESLKKMLDDGLISKEDYDKKKDEILSRM